MCSGNCQCRRCRGCSPGCRCSDCYDPEWEKAFQAYEESTTNKKEAEKPCKFVLIKGGKK